MQLITTETIVIVGQQKILVVFSRSLGQISGQVPILMWNDMPDNSNCDCEVIGDEMKHFESTVKRNGAKQRTRSFPV